MTPAGPCSNQIPCNETSVTRSRANQDTVGDEGALTFYKLESWWVSLFYKWNTEYDPRMHCLSESQCSLTSRTKPRVCEACRSRKASLACRLLLLTPPPCTEVWAGRGRGRTEGQAWRWGKDRRTGLPEQEGRGPRTCLGTESTFRQEDEVAQEVWGKHAVKIDWPRKWKALNSAMGFWMHLGGYWGAPESSWIRKWASQGDKLERDRTKWCGVTKEKAALGYRREGTIEMVVDGHIVLCPGSVLYFMCA